MTWRRACIGLGVLAGLLALVVSFDWLAGALIFVSFHQVPTGVRWSTLLDAWTASASNPLLRHKVQGAMSGAALGHLLLAGAVLSLAGSMRRQKSLHGDAKFATRAELKKAGLLGNEGIILGKMGNEFIRFSGPEFVLLAAPTRSGKGVSFVIPNLLTWEGSAVVLDIKGENYDLTSAFRAEQLGQQVFVFNPFAERSHCCNFLTYVSEDEHFRVNDLQALAAIIYPDDRKSPFWSEQARNLFVGLGLLLLETPSLPRTLGEMLRQASGKGQPTDVHMRDLIELRATTRTPLSSACTNALNRFLQAPEETLRNILASFTAPLAPFENPVIDKATSRDDFDLRDLRKKKMTLYLNVPAGKIAEARFLLNLLFSILINENVKELPEQNPALKYPCLLLMDEFAAAGRIPAIAKGIGFIAGYNLRLVIIIQDRAQLEAEDGYGRSEAQNILANMGVTIFFTPRTEREAEAYSKLIGYETLALRQRQRSNIGLGSGKSSVSETELQQRRAVMLPQEVRSLSSQKELVQRPGVPVILADKIIYFADPFLVKRLNSVPQMSVEIGGRVRLAPRPRALPKPDWIAYENLLAEGSRSQSTKV